MLERLRDLSPERDPITQEAIDHLHERVPEIASVLEKLLAKGLLERANLSGRIVDLGTFLGAGVLALARYGPESSVGVEIREMLSDGTDLKVVLGDNFVQGHVRDYLSSCPPGRINLLTPFYTNIPLHIYFDLLKTVLAPGGQLLVTTDFPNNVSSVFNEEGTNIVPISFNLWRELPELERITEESHWQGSRDLLVQGRVKDSHDRFVYVYTKPTSQV